MEKESRSPENARHVPTGGVPLSKDRSDVVTAQWEAMHRSIRLMDDLELGETEPATVYIWWGCQP